MSTLLERSRARHPGVAITDLHLGKVPGQGYRPYDDGAAGNHFVHAADGPSDLMIGDAAYTPRMYAGPPDSKLPPGQASDPAAWRRSLQRIHAVSAARVHFCHHTDIIHA